MHFSDIVFKQKMRDMVGKSHAEVIEITFMWIKQGKINRRQFKEILSQMGIKN